MSAQQSLVDHFMPASRTRVLYLQPVNQTFQMKSMATLKDGMFFSFLQVLTTDRALTIAS